MAKKKTPEWPCPKCGAETRKYSSFSIARDVPSTHSMDCEACGWHLKADSPDALMKAYFKERRLNA